MRRKSEYEHKPTFMGRLEQWGIVRLAVKWDSPEEGAEKWRLWFQKPPKGYRWW